MSLIFSTFVVYSEKVSITYCTAVKNFFHCGGKSFPPQSKKKKNSVGDVR